MGIWVTMIWMQCRKSVKHLIQRGAYKECAVIWKDNNIQNMRSEVTSGDTCNAWKALLFLMYFESRTLAESVLCIIPLVQR